MRPYTDLYGMLQEVRKRPSMFVFHKSLADLERMIWGYACALDVHGVTEWGADFNPRFSDYLESRFRGSLCKGWAHAVTSQSRDADEAFDRFFSLLDEFRASGP